MFYAGDTEDEKLFSMSDEDVLLGSLGHPSSFSILLDRYQGRFLKKAKSIVGSHEDAEDAVQDTFVKVYKNAEKFLANTDRQMFRAWAYKILLNTCFTKYQKLKKKEDVLPHEILDLTTDANSEHTEDRIGFKDYVGGVLDRMPDKLSRVLRLHFLEGLPHRDIAEKEGVTVNTIKLRVHRAKKEFKKISALAI